MDNSSNPTNSSLIGEPDLTPSLAQKKRSLAAAQADGSAQPRIKPKTKKQLKQDGIAARKVERSIKAFEKQAAKNDRKHAQLDKQEKKKNIQLAKLLEAQNSRNVLKPYTTKTARKSTGGPPPRRLFPTKASSKGKTRTIVSPVPSSFNDDSSSCEANLAKAKRQPRPDGQSTSQATANDPDVTDNDDDFTPVSFPGAINCTVKQGDIEYPSKIVASVRPTPAQQLKGGKRNYVVAWAYLEEVDGSLVTFEDGDDIPPEMTREELVNKYPDYFVMDQDELERSTIELHKKRVAQHKNGGCFLCAYCGAGVADGELGATERHQFGALNVPYVSYKSSACRELRRQDIGCWDFQDYVHDHPTADDLPPTPTTYKTWRAAPRVKRGRRQKKNW